MRSPLTGGQCSSWGAAAAARGAMEGKTKTEGAGSRADFPRHAALRAFGEAQAGGRREAASGVNVRRGMRHMETNCNDHTPIHTCASDHPQK